MFSSSSSSSSSTTGHKNRHTTTGVHVSNGFCFTSINQLVESLQTHRVNTLTELRRIERIAATTENEAEARAFQGPMTAAWTYYVSTNLLTELRGLTPSYPFSASLACEARLRVVQDPNSNRSWNMAWLCLHKMLDENLIAYFANAEAAMPHMWAGQIPAPEDVQKLAGCFEIEWTDAVVALLRHWPDAPVWY